MISCLLEGIVFLLLVLRVILQVSDVFFFFSLLMRDIRAVPGLIKCRGWGCGCRVPKTDRTCSAWLIGAGVEGN